MSENIELINLKCIDDFNNRFLLLLKTNINNLLQVLKIEHEIDFPESKLFSENKEDVHDTTFNPYK